MKLKALVSALLLLASSCAISHADTPITYTVEPFDMDGFMGISMNLTQLQFGGKYCPCEKIPYIADGWHNQQGADAIAKIPFKNGDRLMGFSLGNQVISLALSQHTLIPSVSILLAGDTFAENDSFNKSKKGIPANILNQVTMVVNEYDGWSDMPTKFNAGWGAAFSNALTGAYMLHYYVNANPDDPANVVVQHGNIKAVLVPTIILPTNSSQRNLINTAYDRPGSSVGARSAASAQQVPQPNPIWPNKPEPAASG